MSHRNINKTIVRNIIVKLQKIKVKTKISKEKREVTFKETTDEKKHISQKNAEQKAMECYF